MQQTATLTLDAKNNNTPSSDLVGNIPQYIDDILEVIKGCHYPMTISINGEWGSGKTTFLQAWSRREDIASIYIDAFATDYLDSPLETIIWKLATFFDDKKILNAELPEKRDEYYTKQIFKALGQVLARVDIEKEVSKLSGGVNSTISENTRIETYINTLKQRFSKAAKKKAPVEHGLPLFVFIDELDRCRPTYAVEFIEAVKHFFDIENTVFVFAINRRELASSITKVQGCADADRYLKKFFDLNYELPQLPYREFIQHLVKKNKYGVEEQYCDSDFVDTFAWFAEKLALPARDQVQYFNKVVIALKKMKLEQPCKFLYPLILWAIIREHTPQTYDSYKKHALNHSRDFNLLNSLGFRFKGNQEFFYKVWLDLSFEALNPGNMRGNYLYIMSNKSHTLAGEERRLNDKDEKMSREEMSLWNEMIAFQTKCGQIFMPKEAAQYGSLMRYIDSLLNFADKFAE